MSDQLVEQLKKLKSLEPSESWVAESQAFLMSKIAGDRYQEISLEEIEKYGLSYRLRAVRLAWKPVGVFAMVALLMFGGTGLTVIAAQDSVPGDNLFAVKKIIERSQDMVATDNSHKVELATKFTSNRVDELQKVIVEETQLVTASGSDSAKVAMAVSEVKKQLDDVNDKFIELKNKSSESKKKKAVAALLLNEKISGYRTELKAAKQKVTNSQTSEDLDSALDAVQEINTSALEVIVGSHNDGDLELEVSEIENKLEDHVAVIEERVAEVEEVLAEKFETDGVELKEQANVAKDKLAKAKDAISKKDYDLVLTLSKDSNEILKMLYGDINSIEVVEPADKGVVEGDTDEKSEEDQEPIDPVDPVEILPIPEPVVDEQVEQEPLVEPEPVEPENGFEVGI